MGNPQKLTTLTKELKKLYSVHNKKLLFHGWHHIEFVHAKAKEFAKDIKADAFLVESAALVHDLNHIAKRNSEAKDGQSLRAKLLKKSGYTAEEASRIEKIILECETAYRSKIISEEGKAVSDADTLFKTLPITPIVFSAKYIAEQNVDIKTLSRKIVRDQKKLLDQGIYFYTKKAKTKYLKWARQQLAMWKMVEDALKDKDVQKLLKSAKDLSII